MSPFAVARERALSLRRLVLRSAADQGVGSGKLIEACLKHHRLTVYSFAPDSPRLNKADAVLLARMKTIVIRNDVAASERARLLGHEIGHVELHPDGMAAHRTGGSDTRSAGTQYVQAYGARERVERQANVFARELLLPRHVVLSLHRSGKSVRAIASELCLSTELVAQQLLDALLLPNVAPEQAETDDRPLTPEQQLAAYDDHRFVNVVAGPGSGKTKTLIGRVKHLIHGGCAAHRILVLTFSNKAAREIVDRLDWAGVRNAQNVWSGTFHQFGLEFIRKYHDLFGVDSDVQVLDKLAQIELASTLLTSLGLEYYSAYDDAAAWLDDMFLKVINRCREELITAAEFNAAVQALPGGGMPQQRDAARIFEAYEARLHELKALDFTALVELPARRLLTEASEFEVLMKDFDHVLVDEYQDVNRATAILLMAFSQHAQRVWVVGDPHQAIYRFRGATLRNLTEFSRDFPDAKRRGLRKNWRTGEVLVDFVNHVAESGRLARAEPFGGLQGNPDQPSLPPHIVTCSSAESVHATLAREIRSGVDGGTCRYRNHLVLARRNDTVAHAAAQLEALGVPCLYFGGFFERAEVRDALSLFQLLVERFPTALTRVAKFPGIQMPAGDVARIQAAIGEDSSLERLRWLKTPPHGLSLAGVVALDKLRRALKGLSWSTNPWDAICRFLMDVDAGLLRHHVDGSVQGSIRGLALWMLAYFCRAHDGRGRRLTLGRLLHRVRQRRRIGDVGPLRELPPEADCIDAVRLMTIHGSKGLEASFVHLLDARESQFQPRDKSLDSRIPTGLLNTTLEQQVFEAEVEADNLLYVAVSRAKQKLTLYLDTSEFPPQETVAFLTYAGNKVSVPAVQAQGIKIQQSGSAPTTFGPTLAMLLAYSSCPKRYYYREVAGLRGAGDASLAARALYAAIDALRQLARNGTCSPRDQECALRAAWQDAGLPAEEEEQGLWRLGARKVAAGLRMMGGEGRPCAPIKRMFGPYELTIEFDSGPGTFTGAGALFLAYDAWKPKADRDLLLDVTAALGSRWEPKPIKLVNMRKETDRDTKGYPNGSVAAILHAMRAGMYPARSEPVKCASCPYLFICED
jgi:superfamily I DNA/RNA helicase/Zn-dependent peptidase ImmA (M78 family)